MAGPSNAPVEAILLGAAQDAGLPQAGCDCPRCQAAHQDPSRRRAVACLGLVDRQAGRSWLVDATPDFREQLHALRQAAPGCPLAGILLTHAHMGHYTGLIHLGREAWNTQELPLFASPAMCRFLRTHAPWSQLVDLGNVRLHPLTPDRPFALSPRLQAIPIPVPHRNEWSDTLAFLVEGPARRLFYCPDIDGWQAWERDLGTFLGEADVALLDGTFFGPRELPGRDLAEIPHPLAQETARRVRDARDGRRVGCQVKLIHLNHTNPLWDPGPEREWLAEQGVGVGKEGERWRLG